MEVEINGANDMHVLFAAILYARFVDCADSVVIIY